jgi:ABC-type Fe3+-hydroxamate transport system substrate-binding protein
MTNADLPTAEPLIDAIGTRHRPAEGPVRIVSLVPSLTELLFDLGLGDQVVGRTHYCIHPRDAVKAVPSLGGTKKVRFDRLMATRPTHALVNIDENPKEMADRLTEAGVSVVVTHPNAPADNLALYDLLGGLFGRQAEAAALSARFRAARDRLAAAARHWHHRKVLYLIWKKPWITVSHNTYISRMLALAGWQTVGHDPARRYPETALDAAALAGVDLVLLSSEPYRFTDEDVASMTAAFAPIGPKVAMIDGEMISWYGSRAITGLDYLAEFAGHFQNSFR